MQASDGQLREVASRDEAGHFRPPVDMTFQFDQTLEALAYVEQGRASGNVVITLD
jgi:NADPH:quinone reductase-like Zn-dependent oxidoreductase